MPHALEVSLLGRGLFESQQIALNQIEHICQQISVRPLRGWLRRVAGDCQKGRI